MTAGRGDRDRRYLTYIRDSIGLVQQHTSSGREPFLGDDVLQDAVIRRLEPLTDATQYLSPALKERHPDIPGQTIADFRNRVAHGYLNIDLDRVWSVIADDLRPLQAVIEQELREGTDDQP